MRTAEFTVTPAHISAGVPGSSTHCPVALAIGEVIHPRRVQVDGAFIHYYRIPGVFEPVTVTTPEDVSIFVDEFDDGLPVEPFTFTVEVPGMVLAVAA
jgi:hypothetical protein